MAAKPKDVLIVISASGNSPNIVKALEEAKKLQMNTIGFCGFDGGKVCRMSDAVLYTGDNNYGIIEDSHSALMHILAQSIREEFHNGDRELRL